MLKRLFVDHLRAVEETYFEHQRNALGFAISMLVGGFACLLHSLVPGIFVTTASRTVRELNGRMSNRGKGGPRLIQVETWDI